MSDRQQIVQRVRSETDSTSRVYTLSWLLESRHTSLGAAQTHLRAKFAGRLQPDHMSIEEDHEGGVDTWIVMVRRWNVCSEWKHSWQAETWAAVYAQEHADLASNEVTVVTRNSRREHQLRAYGQLLLPTPITEHGQ